jgi:hypothetical protein
LRFSVIVVFKVSFSLLGVAGGKKYTRDSIFFKFNDDARKIYGGTLNAYKAGENELKNASYLFDAMFHFYPQFRVPLFAIIDYYGYQVSCIAYLPLERHFSLLYGSDDCGESVKTDASIANVVEEHARLFNLAPHVTIDKNKTTTGFGVDAKPKETVVCLATDVEIHRVLRSSNNNPLQQSDSPMEGRRVDTSETTTTTTASSTTKKQPPPSPSELYFFLDTARLLPPEFPMRESLISSITTSFSCTNVSVASNLVDLKKSIFFQFLRMEYVRAYPKPLCPDAFSPFLHGDKNRTTLNRDVKDATDLLLNVCRIILFFYCFFFCFICLLFTLLNFIYLFLSFTLFIDLELSDSIGCDSPSCP